MTTSTQVSELKINKLTKAQYSTITPSDTELYFITDETAEGLPDQTGNAGKFLTTDGTDASWATVTGGSLPSQTGNAGRFLTTNGTDASWSPVPLRNIGEIVTSQIPLTDAGLHLLDGGMILGGGIYDDFVEYIRELISNSITIQGSLTNNNGVYSGFSNNNYINVFEKGFNVGNNPWEIGVKVHTPSTWSAGTVFFANAGCIIQSSSVGRMNIYLTSANSSTNYDISGSDTSTTILNTNTDYWFKLEFTGSAYIFSTSTDGENYTVYKQVTNSNPVKENSYFRIGLSSRTYAWGSSIDLNSYYIKINNQIYWSGASVNKDLSIFETEANWQDSVSTYGVCGKFVYDSVNNTVRLPKITGIIEGTTDASALGDLVEAGLPNITGDLCSSTVSNYSNSTGWSGPSATRTGAIEDYGYPSTRNKYAALNGGSANTIEVRRGSLDASRSSSIYGNSSTVQPQTIKAFYYIVIATSTKTDIQVDIDEIATDLNDKVNKSSLQEAQVVVDTYVNGSSWYRVYSDGWCEQGGNTQTGSTVSVSVITFLKPFTNINYSVLALPNAASSTGYAFNDIDEKTTTGCTIRSSATCYGYNWIARGYIN